MSNAASLSTETLRSIITRIAVEIGARPLQVQSAIDLLDDGATVPFIARYRKEVTGGLDDTQLRNLEERLGYLRELEDRRAAVIESIRGQGKLDEALEAKLRAADTKAEVEDLYLPYKPKRRTRGEIARERGLEPLANLIFDDRSVVPSVVAAPFVAGEVTDVKAALDGARDILSERFAENAALLGQLRTYLRDKGELRAKVVEGKEEAGAKFSDYFDHHEPLAKVAGHRVLAMLRGRNEEMLSLDIEVDADDQSPYKPVERMIAAAHDIRDGGGEADAWLMNVCRWTWRVKLSTTLNLDLMTELRARAEAEAIEVFARNLKALLLAAPAGPKVTIGFDPGIRTGCKLAVVDATGKLLDTATIYPFQPRNDVRGATDTLLALIAKHRAELIAIGNGTASRESEKLVDRRAGADAGWTDPAAEDRGQRGRGLGLFGLGTGGQRVPAARCVLARRGVDRPPPAGPAGRAGQDRPQVDRGRPVPARCRPVPAGQAARRGGRGRRECGRCRSQHGLGAAAGAGFGPEPQPRRRHRLPPRPARRVPVTQGAAGSVAPRAEDLRAVRRLPAHP